MEIDIREARPGMILDEEIALPLGIGKLRKSAPLTEENIKLLLRAGIARLSILETSRDSRPESSPAASPDDHHNEPPKLTVAISRDGMEATLIVDPAGSFWGDLPYENILGALDAAGVTTGIDRNRLPEIVFAWRNQKQRYAFEGIAKGTPSIPGQEGKFSPRAAHLAESADAAVVRNSRYYWEAAERLGKLQRIVNGSVIAEKLFDTPVKPGVTVKGEPVVEERLIESTIIVGEGTAVSPDRKRILATKDGVLFFDGASIAVYPLDWNGAFELDLDGSKMAARLVVHPPGEGGAMPPRQVVADLLTLKRVTVGIKNETIDALFESFDEGKFPREPVAVAEGIAPIHGVNGKVDYLFNTATSLAPKVNPDGSVDYKSVDIIISVPKGKELAKMLPPTRGTPGRTIFGEPIPCKDGVPGILPIGPNTEPSPTDDDLLIASTDGIVRFTGAYVEICEGFIIQGDVDFATGNIKYDKSVIVGGDIKAGFSVECGGDLQVSGIIEDSAVTVGGNVLCKQGFVGQGKGVIEAKGDVNLGFIMNQTVKSRKSVNIAKEAINSTIYARHTITVHGKPLSIAGGTFVAREAIAVFTVGNHSGVRTNLEVGLDFSLEEELKKNDEMVADLGPKRQKLIESAAKFKHLSSLRKRLSVPEEQLFNKLQIAVAKIDEQLQLLEKRKKIIVSKLHELDYAHITIEHSAMPGTLFKIGERRSYLKEEVIGPKTVRLVQQEIVIL
jgi:uncharacterized protein